MEEQIQGVNISEERIKSLLKANGLSVAEDLKDQWLVDWLFVIVDFQNILIKYHFSFILCINFVYLFAYIDWNKKSLSRLFISRNKQNFNVKKDLNKWE